MPIFYLIIFGTLIVIICIYTMHFKQKKIEKFILTLTQDYNLREREARRREFQSIQSNHAFALVHMTEKQLQKIPRIIYAFTEQSLKTRLVLITNIKLSQIRTMSSPCTFTAEDPVSFYALEKLVHGVPLLQKMFIDEKAIFTAPQEHQGLSLLESKRHIMFALFLSPHQKIQQQSHYNVFDYMHEVKKRHSHPYDHIAFLFPLSSIQRTYYSDIFKGFDNATHIDIQNQYELLGFDLLFYAQNPLSISHDVQNALDQKALEPVVNQSALNFYKRMGYPIFENEFFNAYTMSPIHIEIDKPLSFIERTLYPHNISI